MQAEPNRGGSIGEGEVFSTVFFSFFALESVGFSTVLLASAEFGVRSVESFDGAATEVTGCPSETQTEGVTTPQLIGLDGLGSQVPS